jgi:hypothetical protein
MMKLLIKLIKMHPMRNIWSDKNDTRNWLIIAVLILVAGILIYLSLKDERAGEEADIRMGQSDFTTYCYDYNDVGSSPYLRSPYKIKLYYSDLSSSNAIQKGGTDLSSQPESSVQIVNNTSQNPLHVFLQCGSTNQMWTKIAGNGEVAPSPIDWGSGCEPGSSSCKAFDPLGADIFQEVKVPQGASLILKIPDGPLTKQGTFASRMFAVHMKNPGSDFLNENDSNPKGQLSEQKPILVEGGKDVVADMSAVDGINFKVRYELTSDNGQTKVMNILKNPCDELSTSGGMDVGCANPVKSACKQGAVTAECQGDQNCKFNSCSSTLFDIPDNMKKYLNDYDGGNKNGKPVKSFINDSSNLKIGSDLRKFCDTIQSDLRRQQGGNPQPTPPPPTPQPQPTPPPPTPQPTPPPAPSGQCPQKCASGIQCIDGQLCPDGSRCPPSNGCAFQCCS